MNDADGRSPPLNQGADGVKAETSEKQSVAVHRADPATTNHAPQKANGKLAALPWAPASVHLFTAVGAVVALLATRAMLNGAWEEAFGWLGLALLIDGIDGPFARRTQVAVRLPRFSGERLDLIIDYLTYVFVPALMLLQAGYLTGLSGLILASLILLSSLYHFSDTGSKCESQIVNDQIRRLLAGLAWRC